MKAKIRKPISCDTACLEFKDSLSVGDLIVYSGIGRFNSWIALIIDKDSKGYTIWHSNMDLVARHLFNTAWRPDVNIYAGS